MRWTLIAFNRCHSWNSSNCNTLIRWRFKRYIFRYACILSIYARSGDGRKKPMKTFVACFWHFESNAQLTRKHAHFSLFYLKHLCTESNALYAYSLTSPYKFTLMHTHIYIHSNRIFKTLSWNDFKLNGINAGTMFEFKIFHRDTIDAPYYNRSFVTIGFYLVDARERSHLRYYTLATILFFFIYTQIPFSKSNLHTCFSSWEWLWCQKDNVHVYFRHQQFTNGTFTWELV